MGEESLKYTEKEIERTLDLKLCNQMIEILESKVADQLAEIKVYKDESVEKE